jgi:hypothetical protein
MHEFRPHSQRGTSIPGSLMFVHLEVGENQWEKGRWGLRGSGAGERLHALGGDDA